MPGREGGGGVRARPGSQTAGIFTKDCPKTHVRLSQR